MRRSRGQVLECGEMSVAGVFVGEGVFGAPCRVDAAFYRRASVRTGLDGAGLVSG